MEAVTLTMTMTITMPVLVIHFWSYSELAGCCTFDPETIAVGNTVLRQPERITSYTYDPQRMMDAAPSWVLLV